MWNGLFPSHLFPFLSPRLLQQQYSYYLLQVDKVRTYARSKKLINVKLPLPCVNRTYKYPVLISFLG
jgi:hypothetical protein